MSHELLCVLQVHVCEAHGGGQCVLFILLNVFTTSSFSHSYSPSGSHCSIVGSSWPAGAARKSAPVWDPLYGPELLLGACSNVGSLWAAGFLFHCGPSWVAGVQPASPWSSTWAAGESLL